MIASLLIHILINYQLKKEGRRNEYEMHKLLALNQRQKMVSCQSWCSNILLLWPYFDAVYPTIYMLICRYCKGRQKKLPWLQKGWKNFWNLEGLPHVKLWVRKFTVSGSSLPYFELLLISHSYCFIRRFWRWECSRNSGTSVTYDCEFVNCTQGLNCFLYIDECLIFSGYCTTVFMAEWSHYTSYFHVLVFWYMLFLTCLFYFKALMKAIEHELEVTVRVHEVRSAYERQIEEYVPFST